jgi:hypothetical protein
MNGNGNDSQRTTLNLAGSLVAVMVVGLLWFISWALVYKAIPPENTTNLSQIIGMIGIQVGIVIGWFFGSSLGAKAKDDTISTQSTTIQALTPTPASSVSLAPGESATVHADEVRP